MRDLVEVCGIWVVLAQDADRITRDPGHRAFLDDEFERLGTRLVALDDWGNDTHEGELLKFLKGWVSKGEPFYKNEAAGRYLLESFFGPGARENWQRAGKIPFSGPPENR